MKSPIQPSLWKHRQRRLSPQKKEKSRAVLPRPQKKPLGVKDQSLYLLQVLTSSRCHNTCFNTQISVYVHYVVAVKYDPKKTKFPHARNIPEELLDDVISCFNKKEVVCRKCFYENGKRSMFVKHPRGGGDVCQNCKIMVPPLVPLIVIPASERCVSNLPCSGWVALPPRPTDRSTYEYCGKGGTHSRCFSYLYRNLWFTHTVEELVVWTIERDTGKSPFNPHFHK